MANKRYGGKYCCVVGCHKNDYSVPKVSMYSFPSEKKDSVRRYKWIQAVKRIRENGSVWVPTKYSKICSDHFLTGKPVYHPDNPDYIPTIFPSAYCKKPASKSSSDRFIRAQKRPRARESGQFEDMNNIEMNFEIEPEQEIVKFTECAVQTDDENVPDESATSLTFSCAHDGLNCGTLIISPVPKKVINSGTSVIPEVQTTQSGPEHRTAFFNGYKSIIHSEESYMCNELCGVSTTMLAVLLHVFGSKNAQKNELKYQDKVVLFLMKMKLNLTFSALGALFSIHQSTASKIFHAVLGIVCVKTRNWIHWLPKAIIQDCMPQSFQPDFVNCRTIIDCFEIKTEIPKSVEKQNYLYSHYKSGKTAKYLICLSPHGQIMHDSKGYGGRSTDGRITLESELTKELQPGDVVLADRGFPQIKISCEAAGAIVIMPPFTNGKEQFSTAEMEQTYKIASVRIHVERVIQRLCIFNIINHKVPIELLPYLDDIVQIACVCTNIGPPIIASTE